MKDIGAPQGAVTTMVDIDERRGDVIRVLVAPAYRRSLQGIPETFMGYPVIVERQPRVYVSGGGRR